LDVSPHNPEEIPVTTTKGRQHTSLADESAAEPTAPQKTPKRAALSSWVGSALEYYDFAVYGTAAALVVNELFFPEGTSPGVAVLASMATVGIAYVVRPLGALIMGPLADRFGRRFVLMLSLFMIGVSTFLVGCLPTYDQVGLLAPALLALCRVIQGISASGEQGSAIAVSLEHAEEQHRSWTTACTARSSARCWPPPCSSPSRRSFPRMH
jgi:MFS family permease